MSKYQDYRASMSKIADINHSIAVLSWDQEVYMPSGGADSRSQQIATLSGIAHELFTKASFGESLRELVEDQSLSAVEKRNVELTLKDYNKSTKFTESFIVEKSKVISSTYHAWIDARKANDWTDYAIALEKLVNITKQESEIYGYKDHPYDPHLDIYEPTMTVAKLEVIFADVKNKLSPLIKKIRSAEQVEDKFLFQDFDKDKQYQYGLDILKEMGYDFNRGRQDVSAHPFTTSFSANDVRVTTRLQEDNFPMMLWSCIHEGGHALYEQGIPDTEYGLPSGSAISLGIHESQSRLWENNVGRSKEYWTPLYSELQETFPKQLSNYSVDDYFKAMNRIEPNYIRTQADELHYHFHVMIRYEIERDLLGGKISVGDLRDAWNDRYEEYLGLRPKDDNEGILQDIHWSHGSFGYFPTYSLGSFYAAQFFDQACKDIPLLKSEILSGNTKNLLHWLRENIHQHGHSFEAEELCEKITGSGLRLDSFINYVEEKFKTVYNL